jgi:hypothetical protein
MSLTPRYWWRSWCKVWWAWHLDIYRGVSLFKHYITFVINIEVSGSSNSTSLSSSISRCQALQILHHFRHQYRGVRPLKLYINFVINIEVSGSSNSTSLSSSISSRQPLQILHQRYWRRKWCRVWRVWHLDIDDESDVEFEEPDTSILMTKVM